MVYLIFYCFKLFHCVFPHTHFGKPDWLTEYICVSTDSIRHIETEKNATKRECLYFMIWCNAILRRAAHDQSWAQQISGVSIAATFCFVSAVASWLKRPKGEVEEKDWGKNYILYLAWGCDEYRNKMAKIGGKRKGGRAVEEGVSGWYSPSG